MQLGTSWFRIRKGKGILKLNKDDKILKAFFFFFKAVLENRWEITVAGMSSWQKPVKIPVHKIFLNERSKDDFINMMMLLI